MIQKPIHEKLSAPKNNKPQKRFRVFAGPNGSGKSTLFYRLREKRIIHTEYYISADRIELNLKESNTFHFNAYGVSTNQEDFLDYANKSAFFKKQENNINLNKIRIKSGVLTADSSQINSYLASIISSYLLNKLLLRDRSFCFETVMSHKSKIDLLKMAKLKGFKTYLYFLFTQSEELNVLRVKQRVAEGGHFVPENKIRERYHRCFNLLPEALPYSDRVYIFDNSGEFPELVGEGKQKNISWKPGYHFEELSKLITQE